MTEDYSKLSDAELLTLLVEKRVLQRKRDLGQKVSKIALNSLYGCMGNEFFVFYETRMAEAITMTGQLLIRIVADKMNDWLREITGRHDFDFRVAGDTDSTFFNFLPVAEKYFPNDSKEDQLRKMTAFADGPGAKKIDEIIKFVCDKLNAFDPTTMKMEREAICDAAIFVAKKRYVLSIVDKEGIRKNPAAIKITGLDSKRAMLPKIIRKKLADSYQVAMYDPDRMIPFVEEFKEEFMTYPVDDIAAISGVNNLEKFVGKTKGLPMHVRASMNHNRFIEAKKLTDLINPITSGDKMKYVMLKMPNPVHDNVFGFEGSWSKLFGLDQYLDKAAQFEKSFISPLTNLTDAINMPVKPKETYDIF